MLNALLCLSIGDSAQHNVQLMQCRQASHAAKWYMGGTPTLKASQQTSTGLLLACAVIATAALPALLSTVPLLSTADAPSITCSTKQHNACTRHVFVSSFASCATTQLLTPLMVTFLGDTSLSPLRCSARTCLRGMSHGQHLRVCMATYLATFEQSPTRHTTYTLRSPSQSLILQSRRGALVLSAADKAEVAHVSHLGHLPHDVGQARQQHIAGRDVSLA